jgi:hypothetical protein
MGRSRKHNQKYSEDKTIEDLVDEIKRLENENKTLRSELSKYTDKHQKRRSKKDKSEDVKFENKKEPIKKDTDCPTCGAKMKESTLPFGKMRLCSSCTFREVIKR